MKVEGNTAGLKPSELRALERLRRRRVDPAQVVSPELARAMTELSLSIHRQVGILLDRRGSVESVVVGTAQDLELPELGRPRAAATRLVGVRLVHTHLKGEPLTRDDFTDLSVLRLDLIAAIEVLPDGLPGRLEVAHLLAENPANEQWKRTVLRSVHEPQIDPSWLVPALEVDLARAQAARPARGAGDRAILVGLKAPGDPSAEESIAEARELARTAGLVVVDTIIQRRAEADPRFVLGKGRFAELVIRSKQLGADLIVFNLPLSASQVRNVAELTDQRIIDRTQLILDIFAQHARSREGKIQVERAQLEYLLPRLSGRGTAMSRLAGGIGARGPGETKLETDRRRIRKRITLLDRELEALSRGRQQRRKLRARERLPVVSIVGYTNAGKSTLLNRLTGSSVLAEDKLFATLDPSSRRLRFPAERDIVITDTVGFLRDLPEELVQAFRATLEELEDADLLLHVVDVSSPTLEEHIQSVEKVLSGLSLEETPRLLVFNKADRVAPDLARAIAKSHDGLAISAERGDGMEELVRVLRARVGPGRA